MGTCIIWHSLKYVPNNKSNVLEEDHGQGNIFYVVFIHDRILTTYRTVFLQSILRIKQSLSDMISFFENFENYKINHGQCYCHVFHSYHCCRKNIFRLWVLPINGKIMFTNGCKRLSKHSTFENFGNSVKDHLSNENRSHFAHFFKGGRRSDADKDSEFLWAVVSRTL